jgi:helix-turn-helix protein
MNVLEEELLSDEELAAILEVAPKTPAQWRHRGVGPRYIKYGRIVRYRPSDVREYVNKHVVEPSPKLRPPEMQNADWVRSSRRFSFMGAARPGA